MKLVGQISTALALSGLLLIQPAHAQFSSDSLSFFEKPLSFRAGNGIAETNALFELGYRSDNDGAAKYDTQQVGARFSYQTQLSNDWDLNIEYLADYETERSESYQDLFRASLKDEWGELQVGDISTTIFERTNRMTAIGLLGIDNDNFTLPLRNYGVFYQWSTPASRWMIAADSDANVELGLSYYQPIGGFEYTFSARANNTENDEGDAQGVGKSEALALVAQVERGRWAADMQYLREELSLLFDEQTFNLQALSGGLHYRFNRWRWSLTGINRENELNDEERVVSLGLRYDIARGLSLNAGASTRNSKLFPEKFNSFASTIRYEF